MLEMVNPTATKKTLLGDVTEILDLWFQAPVPLIFGK